MQWHRMCYQQRTERDLQTLAIGIIRLLIQMSAHLPHSCQKLGETSDTEGHTDDYVRSSDTANGNIVHRQNESRRSEREETERSRVSETAVVSRESCVMTHVQSDKSASQRCEQKQRSAGTSPAKGSDTESKSVAGREQFELFLRLGLNEGLPG